ncbi:aminotransferase class IV family protein [Stenotrophomonas rhizophila]|uniref:aminotransferase class IV family protein n=1 Tax=Stenotrophomonas rhizophila TaxID=216778 RepID=UPI001E589BAB|nr:aminotransferase class IV family protein [Stenotrophomonas rhizophila]MCC7634986.1 aminotransferase class IV family protein [Stenotrophomonas rhizophila]MCC7662637.1 aminotransferase class IV family protein [Stenotrophomonas rhizophila]
MSLYCNGHPAGTDDLAAALANYGHFTSLQVRGAAVQGLDLHLQRLQQGTAELFGAALDPARVQAWMAQALQAEGVADAALRVTVFSRRFDFRQPLRPVEVDVLVAVAAPVHMPADARRLRTVVYQRELPHLKHVGTFALFAQRRRALQDGFDDALFITDDGQVSEGSTWNIAFQQGRQIVWPQAPALRGTQERLLQAGFAQQGQQVRAVALSELGDFDGAVACNSAGVWPIAAVDSVLFPESEALCQRARGILETAPWQPIGKAGGAG